MVRSCATLNSSSACNGNDLSLNPATRKGGCRVNSENGVSLDMILATVEDPPGVFNRNLAILFFEAR